MKTINRITFLKLFLFSINFIVLLTLGVWQLNKDHLRKIKSTELDKVLNEKPILLNTIDFVIDSPAQISIAGTILYNKPIYMEPRTYKGQVGYHKIVPIKADNKLFLVNKGFTKKKTLEQDIIKNKTITGIIIKIPKKNIFSLENDLQNNKWYTYDVNDFKTFLNQEVEPYIIYETGDNLNSDYKQVMPNIVSQVNHLHYAITWFLVALSACIIFRMSLRDTE